MATIFTDHRDWHAGEISMHKMMSAPTDANPTNPGLSPNAGYHLASSPLVALGILDAKGQPWTTVWGGMAGFARPMRVQKGDGEPASAVGMRALVSKYDPVLDIIEGRDEVSVETGESSPAGGKGKKVSGLAINLAERNRAKWAGTVMGGVGDWKDGNEEEGVKDLQLLATVDSSLGNCPKYLNKKNITPHVSAPTLLPNPSDTLSEDALALLSYADCMFITSSNGGTSLSTNYRGGPKGFIRVVPPSYLIPPSTPPPDLPADLQPSLASSNSATKIRLVYPEYSGNRLYQTLGNLITTPLAGIVIPGFETGMVLYATCRTQIVHGKAAAAILPRSNLAVVLYLTSYRLVQDGLGFRGEDKNHGMSPYNPTLRFVAGEDGANASFAGESGAGKKGLATATIVGREMLSSDIARVTFQTDQPVHWTRGQAVLLSFAEELDTGYSHMRDEDPKSLNDDYVRSFTVSSPAPSEAGKDTSNKFEVTVRNVGPCTRMLATANPRGGLDVEVLGFGGEFIVKETDGKELVFVAGGIGITPLLAQVESLKKRAKEVRLIWALRKGDVGLLNGLSGILEEVKVVVRISAVGESDLATEDKEILDASRAKGMNVGFGRLQKGDFDALDAQRWFVCAGRALSRAVEGWAAEKGVEVVQESFNY